MEACSVKLIFEEQKWWADDFGRKREATPEEIEQMILDNEKMQYPKEGDTYEKAPPA